MKIIAIFCIFSLLLHVGLLLADSGVFSKVTLVNPFNCQSVPGIPGAEDMAILGPYLVATSGYFPPKYPIEKTYLGGLVLIPIHEFQPVPEYLNLGVSFPFNPHGLDVLKIDEDLYKIFVVNHRPSKDSIEVFEFRLSTKKVKHLTTHFGAEIETANDVLAIDASTFLVSLDHSSRNHRVQMLENFSRIGWGSIFLFHNGQWRKIVSNLSFANGLAWKDHGKSFLVAEMLGKKIHSYDLRGFSARHNSSIPIDGFPDNLVFNPKKRDFLIGVHPKIFDLKNFAEGKISKSPTRILRLKFSQQEPKLETVFEDPGDMHSSGSVAIDPGEALFIGSIYESKILRCAR